MVIDPVMVAESGGRLLDDDAVDALRTRLIPRATVITPNLAEAAVLAGSAAPRAPSPRSSRGPCTGSAPAPWS